VEVPAGTSLLEAAAEAGLLLEAECGGRGTCGSCLMEVRAAGPGGEPLDEAARLVYGCREVVDRDLVATPLATVSERRRVVTGCSYLLAQRTRLASGELRPVCRGVPLEVPPPTLERAVSDRGRLVRAVAGAAGVAKVRISLQVLRGLPDVVRRAEGRLVAALWDEDGAARVTDLRAGGPPPGFVGVACDLGTSTVAVQLLDLDEGRTLAVASDYNRQVRSGADVVTRIDQAGRPGGLDRLRDQALTTLRVLLRRVCAQADLSPTDIRALVVSGNTTMVHLLLGVQPRHIREEPYVPVFAELPSVRAVDLGLEVHPQARLWPVPAVGSFVGGDIVSGLLCVRRFVEPGELYLFVDIGTNGEIVLGSDDWQLTCACSAGPAFEGSGVRCGMRAAPGAIERIELTDDGDVAHLDVVGGGRPKGLCGSGLIQLLGELLRTGLVDRGGQLRDDPPHPRIVRHGQVWAYVVVRGEQTDSGLDLLLTDSDLENLVRTKAAIFSGCSLLLKKVGLAWSDLQRVYVAGGFGRYVAVEQAVTIGLLPDVPEDRFVFLGNSSLAGARLALLSTEERDRALELARTMTYVELSAEPGYMDEYTGALFLPHTDLGVFPSVGERLAGGRGA